MDSDGIHLNGNGVSLLTRNFANAVKNVSATDKAGKM